MGASAKVSRQLAVESETRIMTSVRLDAMEGSEYDARSPAWRSLQVIVLSVNLPPGTMTTPLEPVSPRRRWRLAIRPVLVVAGVLALILGGRALGSHLPQL